MYKGVIQGRIILPDNTLKLDEARLSLGPSLVVVMKRKHTRSAIAQPLTRWITHLLYIIVIRYR
jgi:hypothetical protein